MADENRFGEIISKCWSDAGFKKRFVAEPKKVFAEFGMDLPADLEVKVVENSDNVMYLVIPPKPSETSGELSDSQLDAVSGGATIAPIDPRPVAKPTTSKCFSIIVTSTAYRTCTTAQECAPQ
jgi:hypothetical protein